MTRVLLVDDEENLRLALRTHLRKQGYEVSAVGSVDAALAELERDPVDFLVTDVKMPGRSGLELLTVTRQRWPATVVVVMSAYGSHEDALAAIKGGAQDYLTKPFAPGDLAFTIRKAEERESLKRENKELRAQLARDHQFDALVARSDVMKQLFATIARVAAFKTTVLIQGETGVGKELVARAIHEGSKRAEKPMEKLNCAAVPQDLIESELFGHEAGAFTGALKARAGKFERAHGSTLFLDEVGDMPASMQAKLLRVLQEGEVERVGGGRTLKVDVRVVAATNRDLAGDVASGRFRADLFDRLHVVPIHLPPLRARRDDVPLLVSHFLPAACRTNDRAPKGLTQGAVNLLQRYTWPGNVRELRNLIERLVILTPSERVDEDDVRAALPAGALSGGGGGGRDGYYAPGVALKDILEACERDVVVRALEHHKGNATHAARDLGLERSHFYKKMRALGIKRPGAQDDDEGET